MSQQQQDPHYSVKNGLLYWKQRVVVLQQSALVAEILHEFHDSSIGRHLGVAKTTDRICSQIYWPKMQQQIRNYVLNCAVCQ